MISRGPNSKGRGGKGRERRKWKGKGACPTNKKIVPVRVYSDCVQNSSNSLYRI